MNITITPESEWLSSSRMSASDMDNDSLSDVEDAKPPVHPVPQMQGAFEESMMETLNESEDPESLDRMSTADSVSRRKMLLEQDEYQRTVAGRWKQRPGEQFHPLWKLVAQISFGMHLLQQGLAKSDEEVIKILQTHVDEIDGFLERTTEDFDLAQGDIDERIRYLKLPLEHGSVFDTMLNDRNFRIAIVEGNEKIEHIIDRTAAAMNDSLKDVQKGLDATRELAKYLTRVDKQWDERTEEHDSVYLAMIGNTEGWTRAFLTLQSKGNALRRALVQLGGIVAEMQRRAGAASRKNLVPVRSAHGSRYAVESQTRSSHNSLTPPKSPLKPLPTAPSISTRSSSQQHSQHSSSRSQSGQHDPKPQIQHATPPKPKRSPRNFEPSSPRLERAMSAKRVEPILRDTTPEPSKPPKSVEPPMPTKVSGPNTPQESTSRDPPSESPASVATSTISNPPSTKTAPPIEITRPSEVEAKPPIPVRSPSRKPSFVTFTERARFHLNRKKSPSKEVERDDASVTSLPIQSPPSRDSPAKRPSSPVFKRLSTRRANAISISTYSASPTSDSKPSESTSSRNLTPVPQSESGTSKPSHSSYNSISFLPLHPQLSPLPDYSTPARAIAVQPSDQFRRSSSINSGTTSKRNSTTIDHNSGVRRSSSVKSSVQDWKTSHITSKPVSRRSSMGNIVHPKRSSSINTPKSAPILDDAGGSVNLQHPLLREARHAKFNTITMPSTPTRGSSRDLPLRHYHSQDNFHSIGYAARPREVTLPKRTSSLFYNPPPPTSPSAHPALSSAPLNNEDKLSPAPAQPSATPAPLHVGSRPGTSTATKNDAETTQSSPITAGSDDSDEADGATPPPISRGVRSPTPTTARLDTNLDLRTKSPAATSPAVKSAASTRSRTSPSAERTDVTASPKTKPAAEAPRFKTSATNNIPFYLNPVSSTALIDFLASTPPPSPPHPPRSNTDPNAFDTQNLYKNYRHEEGSSPVPPGPGGVPMLPFSLAQADPKNAPNTSNTQANKKAVWKRMFGAKGSGGGKNNSSTNATIPKSESSTSNNNNIKPPKQKKTKSSSKKPKRDEFEEMLNRGGLTLPEDDNNRSQKNLQENGQLDIRDFGAPAPGITKRDVDAVSQEGSMRTTTTTAASTGAGNGASVNGEKGGGQSFMGVGKDGMWISRKNFLRT
ncbi:MAG: hypothetical protein L6R42_003416 [Xanthoria sp. 1 TBL-2021]|nr:MAG: hypothetical protein L6R42_003416 [Xanthoria sp. 1 TBL-2021]